MKNLDTNIENNTIVKKLSFKSSIDDVWDAITNPEKLSQWFGDQAKFELIEGHVGYFRWQQHGTFAMCIESIQPKVFFSWRWMEQKSKAFEHETSSLVEWFLSVNSSGGTDLILKESDFNSPKSMNDNIQGWQEELADLMGYLRKSNERL